jgi:hypothetical protein
MGMHLIGINLTGVYPGEYGGGRPLRRVTRNSAEWARLDALPVIERGGNDQRLSRTPSRASLPNEEEAKRIVGNFVAEFGTTM